MFKKISLIRQSDDVLKYILFAILLIIFTQSSHEKNRMAKQVLRIVLPITFTNIVNIKVTLE